MTEELFSSNHPLLPPTTEDDRIAWVRLLRSRRVGVATFYRLMAEHGGAQTALMALPKVAAAAGVRDYAPCPHDVAEREYRAGQALGARLICRGMADYPSLLADLSDAPPFFWALGDTALLARPMIAMVGARNASSLGLRMTRKLAADLGAAGYVVVSGLARGVDAAAHQAALGTGTAAVQAGGVDVIYPAENAELAANIAGQGGLRLSEDPIGLQPQARHFPARNRIIAGLAQALVVVEAAAKSGSLITARAALDLGRDVLAVPGHPFDARAAGCNMLIRDGARLVRSAADVTEALTPLSAPVAETMPLRREQGTAPPVPARGAAPDLAEVARLHRCILDRLGPSPLAEDQLIRDLGAPTQAVMPVLTDLELDGRIERRPGGLLARLH